jgi:hypothetical protein
MHTLTREDVEDISERAAERASTKAVALTLLTIGVDVSKPLEAQRDFSVLREVGRIAMDPEFRKDLESARKWRRELERDDGAADDIAFARRRRKVAEALWSRGALTLLGLVVTGAVGALVVGVQHLLVAAPIP